MKKRIGSRLYDTNASEMIAAVFGGDLYRKRTRGREYFLLSQSDSGPVIVPLTDNVARSLLGDNVRVDREPVMYHIRVDSETHSIIQEEADKQNCTMSEVVRNLAKTLI